MMRILLAWVLSTELYVTKAGHAHCKGEKPGPGSSGFAFSAKRSSCTSKKVSIPFLPSATHPNSNAQWSSSASTTLAAQNDGGKNEAKSIGSYVLDVHGGKYRFEDPSALGTSAGQDFAQSLYASSTQSSSEKEEEAAAAKYDAWPNWAKKMVSISSLPTSAEILKVSKEEVTSVKIQNLYRTWEPYYAKIVRFSEDNGIDNDMPPFEIISKVHGKLAPQGGSDNLCDYNDPYPDYTHVSLRCINGAKLDGDEIWCLVVGTEEEKWYYHLVL